MDETEGTHLVHQYKLNGYNIVLDTCSGGCAANAYHASGSIRGVYELGCELFKKRMECAIMMKAAEQNM
mgnify:CR=1 FL=1